MLSLKTQSKIVEKILRTKTGEYVRAIFLVSEENGLLHVKLLSARPFNAASTEKVFLPKPVLKKVIAEVRKTFFAPVVSPHSNLLSFFNSQPTRAPAK